MLAWMPTIVSSSFVLIRFVWAMSNSQRRRIHKAMEGTRGSMKEQLGFMNKVKTEVGFRFNESYKYFEINFYLNMS